MYLCVSFHRGTVLEIFIATRTGVAAVGVWINHDGLQRIFENNWNRFGLSRLDVRWAISIRTENTYIEDIEDS